MAKRNPKVIARQKRIKRIRKKIVGSVNRPRLSVFKSAKHTYAQVVDDQAGHTLLAVSTIHNEISADGIKGKTAQARKVGMILAAQAKEKGINSVVFDRGGYIYHGRIKALSEGAREGGLVF